MKHCFGIAASALALLLVVSVAGVSSSEAQPGQDPVAEPAPVPAPAPAPAPVGAQPVPFQPGGAPAFAVSNPDHHTHTGFFARGTLGIGFQRMSQEVQGTDATFSGTSGGFFLSLGYAVAPRLIIHGDIGGVSTSDPNVKIDGMEFDAQGSATTVGFGPGVTYYLPSNAYVSGSLLIGGVSFADDDGDTASSETGAGLLIAGGKEWWVGPQMGVGIVGQLLFGSYPENNEPGQVNVKTDTVSFTLNFSATYN